MEGNVTDNFQTIDEAIAEYTAVMDEVIEGEREHGVFEAYALWQRVLRRQAVRDEVLRIAEEMADEEEAV